jgi:hypothetical protein
MAISKLTQDQLKHVGKVAAYAGISAAIAGVVSLIASNPLLFGPLTPVVNILLVTLQKVFTEE